jgi:hypothetical protein
MAPRYKAQLTEFHDMLSARDAIANRKEGKSSTNHRRQTHAAYDEMGQKT